MNATMTVARAPGEGFWEPLRRWITRRFAGFGADPTLKWVKNPEIELVLDLDKSTFSGVGYDDSYSALSFLGPCDEFTRMDGCILVDEDGRVIKSTSEKIYSFQYHTDGFGFGADESHQIDGFHIHLRPDSEASNSRAFTGKVIWQNRTVNLAELDNADTVMRLFGPPDQDETVPDAEPNDSESPFCRHLNYFQDNATWSIYFDRSGRSISLYVSPGIPGQGID